MNPVPPDPSAPGPAEAELASPGAANLQTEAADAPESQWFFAWFKSAMLYLAVLTAYLGAVAGLVAAWRTLLAGKEEQPSLTIYVLAGVLALPLLFAFLFNVLPAVRRRRERELRPAGRGDANYFTTSPREEDPHGFFAHGYEKFLAWARDPQAPLLHLTGVSGSGKSSLLGAYLRPRLENPPAGHPPTRVVVMRSYEDPLDCLKEELLRRFWKERPKGSHDLCLIDILHRAARQLPAGERLLIAFDQFEEFFLLRAAAPEAPGEGVSNPAPAAPIIAEDVLVPLREFLHAFLKDPPEGVTLLFSYREDHRRLLAPLNLPNRNEGDNWLTVEPFDFAAAAAFLNSCPGLKVPAPRMNRVLKEAARQEGSRVVMRPIVANLLGVILRHMSGHPTLWRRRGDLLRGYLRDSLGREMTEERARVLRALLTDFHTAKPRTVADLARETKLAPDALHDHLEHFARHGLLRCLNPAAATPARIWQIAHDFLATLIERVLDGLHRTFWRMVRPWLAPAAVVVALGVFGVWPWVQTHQDIRLLNNVGFTWNEDWRQLRLATFQGYRIDSLEHLAPAMHRLAPTSLGLSDCDALEKLDGIQGLTSLQSLDLSFCRNLQNLDGIQGLTALESLDLSACDDLQNLDGIQGLTSLQDLDLSNCDALQNVDDIKGLVSLQGLDLSNCDALQNVDGIKDLTSLKRLNLSNCIALQNVDVVKGLTSLQWLSLSDCVQIPKETWPQLKAALPKTYIWFPDGSESGPRPFHELSP